MPTPSSRLVFRRPQQGRRDPVMTMMAPHLPVGQWGFVPDEWGHGCRPPPMRSISRALRERPPQAGQGLGIEGEKRHSGGVADPDPADGPGAGEEFTDRGGENPVLFAPLGETGPLGARVVDPSPGTSAGAAVSMGAQPDGDLGRRCGPRAAGRWHGVAWGIRGEAQVPGGVHTERGRPQLVSALVARDVEPSGETDEVAVPALLTVGSPRRSGAGSSTVSASRRSPGGARCRRRIAGAPNR